MCQMLLSTLHILPSLILCTILQDQYMTIIILQMRKLELRENFSRILTICIWYQIYKYIYSGGGGSNGLFVSMVQTLKRFDACHFLTTPLWPWPFLKLLAYKEHWTTWLIVEDKAQVNKAVIENIDIAFKFHTKINLSHGVFVGMVPVSVKWEVDVTGGRVR